MIDWTPCEIGDHAATCAIVALPLDPADPGGATFDVSVARIAAPEPPSRGQLWFVTGGPGDSGVDDLAAAATAHAALAPDLDLLTFDHRGTGGSTRLSCPAQEDPDSPDGSEIVGEEWAPCAAELAVAYGDLLPHITVTAAASDLVALTDLVAEPDDEVYWWGLSYGTFLVQRALFLAPARPTGVLLDGLVPADFDFAAFDGGLDHVARELLALCGEDPVCTDHLGPDPEATARALLADLEGGHCSELGLDAPTARLLAGAFLVAGDQYPTLIPPTIHRLARCAGRDKRAFVHLFDTLFPEEGGRFVERPGHSPVAQRHLTYGDLWGPDVPSIAELQAVVDGSVATTEVSLRFAEAATGWPGLPAPDPRDGQYPATEVPILAMHGGLDPTGPLDRLDGLSAWVGGGLVVVPHVHHVTLNYGDCPVGIQAAFLADPGAPLDTACVEAMAPPNFAGDAEFDERVWGTADRWGDERCGCAQPSSGSAASLLAGLCLVRRRQGAKSTGARGTKPACAARSSRSTMAALPSSP